MAENSKCFESTCKACLGEERMDFLMLGRPEGIKEASEYVRSLALSAFGSGKDADANRLRDVADELLKLSEKKLTEWRAEHRKQLARDGACARTKYGEDGEGDDA